MNCKFCNVEVDDDMLCYGCGEYVCNDCDQTEISGDHVVEQHRSDYVDPVEE